MKRSFQEEDTCCDQTETTPENELFKSAEAKKLKQSLSYSGIAAMTLLSLALTTPSRREEESKSRDTRMPSLRLSKKTKALTSTHTVIPCDDQEDQQVPEKTTACRLLAMPISTSELPDFDCCALREDWRKAFRPLPLPPRLPKLPSGAKAGYPRY